MNYQHLKYFQAVAKEQNYLRASERLFITQPTLSRAIASLEEELGADLFEKSGRNVKITSYGAEFLKYVDRAMLTIDSGVEKVHEMMGRLEGTIQLACIYGYTYGYLPTLISEYNGRYPNVRFQIKPCTTFDSIFQTHMGNTDIGFHTKCTVHMEKYQDLDYFEVCREELVVVVPKCHPMAERVSCRLEEIVGERFVSFDAHSGMLYKTQEMFQEAGLTFVPYLSVSDDQSILNMVKSGVAIACVLQNIAENNSGFSVLKIEDKVDKYQEISIAVKRKANYSAAVTSFIEFVLEHAKS